MECPFCAHKKSKVTDKRVSPEGIRRRRECLKCGRRFTTYEKIAKEDIYVIKKDNSRQRFDREKIIKFNIPAGISFVDLKNVSLKNFKFGITDKIYGAASIRYLTLGAAMAMDMKNAALVTAPINKESIRKAGFKFPGHTEFLGCFTKSKNVTMMLAGGDIRVGLVTRHIPIKEVAQNLKKEKIIKTTLNVDKALRDIFGIKNPKIGISALNPHSGDGGVIGKEEKTVIIPAVKILQRKIKNICGPYPADIIFNKAYTKKLDAVIAMYHDQGLAPLKMLAFETGVNITLNLPFDTLFEYEGEVSLLR